MSNWKHWHLDTDRNNLAWLTFDRAESSTNTFSSEALRELAEVCMQLQTNPPKGLAILSAKENGFAAGADIDEFTTLKNAAEAYAFTKLGNDVFGAAHDRSGSAQERRRGREPLRPRHPAHVRGAGSALRHDDLAGTTRAPA